MNKWEELGQQILNGYKIKKIGFTKGKEFTLSAKQSEFISDFKSKDCLYSGGFGCGKTLALVIKMVLACKCFPNNRVLLGRRTISDAEKGVLQDLFEMIPTNWYVHRVKDGIVRFQNGSYIILFGLDAMQSGSQQDIKKARQKIKSLNLGSVFIDQLEEVEWEVYDALKSRLRRHNCARQMNSTTNPANYWAYNYFIKGEVRSQNHWVRPKQKLSTLLVQGSMLDNKDNLPEDYIEDRMRGKDEGWIKRFVYGIWSMDILLPDTVIGKSHIQRWELIKRKPIAVEEYCEIWEQPKKMNYQIGVDPSEGVVDPGSISVISGQGKKVAKFNGYIPLPALADKVKFLYWKYKKYGEVLIVPEVNAAGVALLEKIKDLNVYKRRHFNYRTKRESQKLGFKTSHESKSALINHFLELCRRQFPKIYDENTIEEFKTFIWTDSARFKGAGASLSFHDDDVMSTMLGFWELTQEKKDDFKLKRSVKHTKKTFQYL